MSDAARAGNGDDEDRGPLSREAGEAKLVRFLKELEDGLASKDGFWEQVAIMRVQAERQAEEHGDGEI